MQPKPSGVRNIVTGNTFAHGFTRDIPIWVRTSGYDAAGGRQDGLFPLAADDVWDRNTYLGSGLRWQVEADGGPSPVVNDLAGWQTITQRAGNRFDANSTYAATPPDHVAVRSNDYERGRGFSVVYNWSGRSSVSVDVSSIAVGGASSVVRRAKDPFGASIASVSGSGNVTLPLAEEFEVFVVFASPDPPRARGARREPGYGVAS